MVEQFERCQEEHGVARYFGACSDLKYALDKCFKLEKQPKVRRFPSRPPEEMFLT